jgi:hypothetical protein
MKPWVKLKNKAIASSVQKEFSKIFMEKDLHITKLATPRKCLEID